MKKRLARIICVLGALGVGLGAFGAHALRASVAAGRIPEGDLATWNTATHYLFIHVFAALFVLLFCQRVRAALAFLAGIAVFSGSLFILVLSQMRWLGAITPIGGVAFIVGWLLMAFDVNLNKVTNLER